MDENFLTEGAFKASIDSLVESKFGDGYTLQDVGELVELTEMTLEDRVNILTDVITKDFENMSKSIDNLQKSLYDMLGLLTDSQVDLDKANENGGITDKDVQKIIDGLKLEERFFPHLYQYLDERFGLNEEKIKNFRAKTEEVISTTNPQTGEKTAESQREGRTQSTAEINRRMGDSEDQKKASRKAFEDQNVFSQRLRLWTEGHKEPSKQGGDDDKKDKKDKNKSDESWVSKIIKVGMIAGMIMDILSKSPEIVGFFKDKIMGEGGLLDKLKEAWGNLDISGSFTSSLGKLWDGTIQPWISNEVSGITKWFQTTFPEIFNTISSLYTMVEGLVYVTMSDEEQEKYAVENPNSDLAIWRKAGGGKLDVWDLGQYRTVFSGSSKDFLTDIDQKGKASKLDTGNKLLGGMGGIETYDDLLSGDFSFNSLLYLNKMHSRLTPSEFAKFLSTIPLPDSLILPDPTQKEWGFFDFLKKNGAVFGEYKIGVGIPISNIHSAIEKIIANQKTEDENAVKHQQIRENLRQASVSRQNAPDAYNKSVFLSDEEQHTQDILDHPSMTETQKESMFSAEQKEKLQESIPEKLRAPLTSEERTAKNIYFFTTTTIQQPATMADSAPFSFYNDSAKKRK